MFQKFLSCFLILCQLFLFPLQGFARGLQGSEEETATLSAAAMTGISTAGGQGLASLIGHEGDLGAAFKDLGSPQFLKSLVANTISAGLLKEVQLGRFGKALTFMDKPQTFLEHGQKALTQAVVQTGVHTALQGSSLENALETTLRATAAGTFGGMGARWLGEMKPELGELFHKAGHLLRGGFEGILLSRDPRTGLLSGMISGVSAETFAEWAHAGGLSKDFAASLGEFSGPLTVLLTLGDKGDIAVAANVAQNAIEDNFCHEEDSLNLTEEEQDQFTEDLQEAGDWLDEHSDPIMELVDTASNLVPQLKGAKGALFVAKASLKGIKLSRKSAEPSTSQRDPAQTTRGEESKSLLPGEGSVGTYGELKKMEQPGDNLSAHHMPYDNYMRSKGIKKNEGIAMMVEDPYPGAGGRHREIHKTLKKQDVNASPREALAQSVGTAKKVYKKDNVYSSEIRDSLKEVIKKNKSQYPDLFGKKQK